MSTHALSFSKNPVFKKYINAICSTDRIVFVLGAGISIESGLPTWSGLLDLLGEEIEDPYLNDLICAEEADPARRAALILSALHMNSGVGDAHRLVSILYRKEPQPSGALLKSLVQLIRQLNGRVKVITLNYDDCLECALVNDGGYAAAEVHPFGLQEWLAWEKCSSGVAILHVHGFLVRDREGRGASRSPWTHKEPIILSEGEYIEYGSTVQELIRKQAENAHLIFVGTSLTDANITHPLSQRYRQRGEKQPIKPAFALLVPSDRPAIEVHRSVQANHDGDIPTVRDLSEQCFRKRRDHIQNTYDIGVVRLNSYSQVVQAILEAGLAIDNRESYFDESKDLSLRYGKRFSRVMDSIYQRFSIGPGGVAPGGEASRALSDELHRNLCEKVTPLLQEFFDQEIDRYVGYRKKLLETRSRRQEKARNYFSEEKFGLYLWLRSALARGGDDDFEVFIAGASSYARRDGTVMAQRSTVSSYSIYASARSVFSGVTEFFSRPYNENLFTRPGEEALDRPWNMYWAVPVALSEDDINSNGSKGRVTVGSLVLQSSKYDQPNGKDFDPEIHSLMAIISRNPDQRKRLSECLSACGVEITSKFRVS